VVTPDDSATAIITIEAPPTPAFFEVTNLQAPATATAGDLIDVSADVTNTGDESATKTVEFRLDLDDSGTLDAGEALDSTSLTLASGETQPVTFSDIDTTGLSGDYLHGVVSPDTAATATITVSEPVPATFEVSNLQAPATVTQGDVIDVSADVTNTGDLSATKTVEFRIDLDDDASIDDETAFLSEDVTLAPGETQTVTFSNVDTASLVADTYVHGVVTPDDVATATLTVEEPAVERTLRIEGKGSWTTYEVVVDGAFTGGSGLQPSDSISADGTTATGGVTSAADEYTFTGNVVSIVLSGPADVYVDGQLVDPADFGDERTIEIVGSGTWSTYEFSVDGEILGGSGLQPSDSISADGTTATGGVTGSSDTYTFTGALQTLDVAAGVTVFVDGQEIDPADFGADRTIEIVGSGTWSTYEVVVDGEILGGSGLQPSDSISADGTTATGGVTGGSDTYTFTGEIQSIDVEPGVTVFVDGVEIDPTSFGDERTFEIVGGGTWSTYEVVVDGEILGGSGLQPSDSISADGTTATGGVTGGSDTYTFTGVVVSVTVDGTAEVFVDGQLYDTSTTTALIAPPTEFTAVTV
jgi:hypothetical protein